MNKKLIFFSLSALLFSFSSCTNTKCDDCFVTTLIYDSSRINDFKTERGSHLQIFEVYTLNKDFENLILATVYMTKRSTNGDTVLIISPNDQDKIKAGYHVLLDSIENIKIGDNIAIQIPRKYSKFLKNRSVIKIAHLFTPSE